MCCTYIANRSSEDLMLSDATTVHAHILIYGGHGWPRRFSFETWDFNMFKDQIVRLKEEGKTNRTTDLLLSCKTQGRNGKGKAQSTKSKLKNREQSLKHRGHRWLPYLSISWRVRGILPMKNVPPLLDDMGRLHKKGKYFLNVDCA